MVPGRLVASLAVCSIPLAACGSPPKPSNSPTSSGPGSALRQAVKFAECMRSNGELNYADPSSSGHTRLLNQIDPNSATFRTAYAACRKDLTSGAVGPPRRQSPSCASRSRSPDACEGTGSRSFRIRLRPMGRASRWARGCISPTTARTTCRRRCSCMPPRPAECSFLQAARSHPG